jgi:RimJ/RimL family protein N-acetyltransferase
MNGPVMVGPVLFGADDMVAAFVKARIPHMQNSDFGQFTALGVVRDGTLLGGVVYNNYNHHDIHASYAFDSPKWCTRSVLRTLFAYPFKQLGCVRMTAIIGRKNKHARKMIDRLGFKLEGTCRKAADGHTDAMIYGLLARECKWFQPGDAVSHPAPRLAAATQYHATVQ